MAKRPPSSGMTRKQKSRIARETRMQRLILITTIVVAASVIGLIGYGVINEYVIIPNTMVAHVNGEGIPVRAFHDRYLWVWFQYVSGEQMPPDDLAQQTLDALIQEELMYQEAERLGLEVDDEEVERRVRGYIEAVRFGNYYALYDVEPVDDSITPTPRPTATPTATFVYTLTPTATRTPDPEVTPTATFTPTATLAGTPSPTPIPTNPPTPTTRPEEEYQLGYDQYLVGVGNAVGLSGSRIEELLHESIRLEILKGEVIDALDFEVPETELQAHAAHILVAEENRELADELFERIQQGESFEELAAEYSTDSSNAYRGGDLGWFAPGMMVQEFDALVFTMPVGAVEGPVHTQFGWHLIYLYDRLEVPLTEYRLGQERQEAFLDYLTTLQDEAEISISEDWMRWVPDVPQIAPQGAPAEQ